MVRYRRSLVPGGTFFLTVNLRDRRRSLLVEYVKVLREIVHGVRHELPFSIDAMVILPDHWHAAWTLPPGDADYVQRIRLIKARFTRRLVRAGVKIAKDHRGEYQLWQKRYWEHTVRDDQDLETHVNYVHFNPVKHGYVTSAIGWPHSTFRRYVDRGLLPANWAGADSERKFGE